jgi:hypothetical protein|tara:strand:+ start:216 stop:389 length:174 start_codon:yes stop_codon:yes gene_type:complete
MKLSKDIPKSQNETEDFIKKFHGKKKYQNLMAIDGKIVSCETTDPEIKDYLKKLGLS